MKYLVVDDEAAICQGTVQRLRRFLPPEDAVECAFCGEDAIRQIAGSPPDVLITDIRMGAMDGLDLMEPPKEWTSDSMMGLLEAVREYDNTPAAIGYTVYYYANDMEMAKGLKVLSIDGVEPSAQAIRAGDYPFLNPYFVAIAKDQAEDTPTRILYDWVLGPAGQKLAALEGYVPIMETEG